MTVEPVLCIVEDSDALDAMVWVCAAKALCVPVRYPSWNTLERPDDISRAGDGH